MAQSSPQPWMPQASAVSASRAMSMTARPVTALSVEREASSRIETARSRAQVRLARHTRSEPCPAARRSMRARTAASRSRSSPSACCGSTTRRGRSASKRRRTARIRRAAAGSGAGRGGLGVGGEHAAVIGQVGAGLVVPFGIEMAARQPLAVDVGGGEVEMQLQPGRRGLGDLAERDLVQVVGGLAGAVGVVVLDPAVEVEEIRPGKDRLELVQDQAVAPLDLIGFAPPGAMHAFRAVLAAAAGGAVLGGGLAARRRGFEGGPERDGLERAVAARGGEGGEVAAADRRQHRGGRAGGGRAAEQVADDGLDGGLQARQAEVAALDERGVGETGVQAAEPGRGGERGRGHRVGGADGGEVGAERVGLDRAGPGRAPRRRRARDRGRRWRRGRGRRRGPAAGAAWRRRRTAAPAVPRGCRGGGGARAGAGWRRRRRGGSRPTGRRRGRGRAPRGGRRPRRGGPRRRA